MNIFNTKHNISGLFSRWWKQNRFQSANTSEEKQRQSCRCEILKGLVTLQGYNLFVHLPFPRILKFDTSKQQGSGLNFLPSQHFWKTEVANKWHHSSFFVQSWHHVSAGTFLSKHQTYPLEKKTEIIISSRSHAGFMITYLQIACYKSPISCRIINSVSFI